MSWNSAKWSLPDLNLLRCPGCRVGRLRRADDDDAPRNAVVCRECTARWPLWRGVPVLFRDAWVKGPDRVMRVLYDNLPGLHDPAVTWLLPVWQLGGTEAAMREGYLRRLQLAQLPAQAKLLEVSIGTGVNVPLIRSRLQGQQLDYWGLDLSEGMLGMCMRKLASGGHSDVQLLRADAHQLPFADATFERVFHVGGIGAFANPRQALAEMVRVAKPGSPIVVVDEALDPDRSHGWWPRMWFEMLTFADNNPHCPVEHVPAGATEVVAEQLGRFYYCLSFRTPS